MKKIRGFTLIELLIVVAIIAILAAIAVPNFLEAQVRAKVSRTRTDMRSLSVATEAYYVDNNIYPAWAVGGLAGCSTYNAAVVAQQGHSQGASSIPNFLMNGPNPNQAFQTMTTPISFITSYPADPFASNRGCTFSYLSIFPGESQSTAQCPGAGGVGWIMWGFGPDVDEYKGSSASDLGDSPYIVYNPAQSQPSPLLLSGPWTGGDTADTGQYAYTYDPTNGTVSGGDIWRIKQ